jgi:hypothetical protein
MLRYITNWYLTRGDSQTAWDRCLPIWHRDGGINDWRGIIGRPFYSPSPGVRLARMFAKRHSSDVMLFLNHTQNSDTVSALCAIDLLGEIGTAAPRTISILTASGLPLNESLREILTSDAYIVTRPTGDPTPAFDTVGSYFRWQFDTPEYVAMCSVRTLP